MASFAFWLEINLAKRNTQKVTQYRRLRKVTPKKDNGDTVALL